MALCFIGLGSNIGDGRAHLTRAWQHLGQHPKITPLTISSPYLSEPVGMESATWFTNAVGVLETQLAPHDLLNELLSVETTMGRNRLLGKDRVIDLDILYYNDLIVHDATLEIPHPEIQKRLFVLAPMHELAPDHVHPILLHSTSMMKHTVLADYAVKKTSW